jgi:hypothetical protein
MCGEGGSRIGYQRRQSGGDWARAPPDADTENHDYVGACGLAAYLLKSRINRGFVCRGRVGGPQLTGRPMG